MHPCIFHTQVAKRLPWLQHRPARHAPYADSPIRSRPRSRACTRISALGLDLLLPLRVRVRIRPRRVNRGRSLARQIRARLAQKVGPPRRITTGRASSCSLPSAATSAAYGSHHMLQFTNHLLSKTGSSGDLGHRPDPPAEPTLRIVTRRHVERLTPARVAKRPVELRARPGAPNFAPGADPTSPRPHYSGSRTCMSRVNAPQKTAFSRREKVRQDVMEL